MIRSLPFSGQFFGRLALIALIFGAAVLPLDAQEAKPKAVIIETAPPPQGANSETVAQIIADQGSQSRMIYATELSGDLSDGYTGRLQTERKSEDISDQPDMLGRGSLSTGVVILLILAAVLLWLRFGGGGMLMARAPASVKKTVTAPEAWNISVADQSHDPRGLLEEIALMPDRAAALVRLLRHCLLAAAAETDSRFARADTERSAFGRLPQGWRASAGLREILHSTELAHYGGRPVTEAEFARSLDLGRTVLLQGPQKAQRPMKGAPDA